VSYRDRRQRERLELRQAILAAARQIAAAQGWQSVTVRKIAEAIEYSPPAIYEYFDSKEAIWAALMAEGFRRMLADLNAIYQAEDDPVERLAAIGRAYWRFAWEQPELYQIMHGLGGVPFGTPDAPQDAKAIFDLVKQAVRDARRAVGARGPATDDMVDIAWATLHGLVALGMSGRLAMDGWKAKTPLVEQAVRQLVRGWRP
jgi:AcrR family transcriptional regulator